jgi:CDP-paratose 2-epimerase
VLVTGGAGFIGGNLALGLRNLHPDWEVVALDSLRRRGSELNLPRLRAAGVEFVHGDVREASDLLAVGEFDAMVECSAEPSALAGTDGRTDEVIATNLLGAINCLEAVRGARAQVIFLSTSRVYPVAPLNSVRFTEGETRFEIAEDQELPGASPEGFSEEFPMSGARTLYGATKLAAEHLIVEYSEMFSIPTVVNRCGVVAGPWQMGKVDQGVFSHWMLSHYFARPLRYIGFSGTGKQVRDLIHVEDLIELIDDQLSRPDHWNGITVNVGGGRPCSLSLLEATTLCREITGNTVEVGAEAEQRFGDVRIYISDCSLLESHTNWRPRRSAREVLEDIFEWIRGNERSLKTSLRLAA